MTYYCPECGTMDIGLRMGDRVKPCTNCGSREQRVEKRISKFPLCQEDSEYHKHAEKLRSTEQKVLWPLQIWLKSNMRELLEPHMCRFMDSLSHLSGLYDKLLAREEKQNKKIEALERWKVKMEERWRIEHDGL